MNPTDTATAQIRDLEQTYAERVNLAVAEDRYDVVDRLAAEYDAELSRLRPAA